MLPSAAKWEAGELKIAIQSAMIEKLRQQGELGDHLVQDEG
jgi:hypothetical protein